MLKFILGLFDGPIVSKLSGLALGVVAGFYASHNAGFSQGEITTIGAAITLLIGHGLPVVSAMSGNSVTSSTADNAHPPTKP